MTAAILLYARQLLYYHLVDEKIYQEYTVKQKNIHLFSDILLLNGRKMSCHKTILKSNVFKLEV